MGEIVQSARSLSYMFGLMADTILMVSVASRLLYSTPDSLKWQLKARRGGNTSGERRHLAVNSQVKLACVVVCRCNSEFLYVLRRVYCVYWLESDNDVSCGRFATVPC